MKRIASIVFAMSLMLTLVYVSACKKKKEDANPGAGVASESNEAQSQWDDALKISEDQINTNGVNTRTESTYPTVTFAPGSGTTGTITVDYGTNGSTASSDGKIRKGKLLITYTDKYRNTGSVITITAQNYYVADKHIKGRRTVTNNGSYSYSVVDSDSSGTSGSYAQVIYSDGTYTTWKSTRTRTWTDGYGTLGNLVDDVYSISGTASGVSRAGNAYTMTITNLIVKLECFLTYYIYMPSGGTISVTTIDGKRSIDYGNGTSCDRDVTYTHTDGKTYDLSL
ncbi:MAG: lipoprotein precursor [Chitinophagaceae bacterium]|nr:lipoprotein precursor [Chitinophagaceae bacterium]